MNGAWARILRTTALIALTALMVASAADAALTLELSAPKKSYLLGEQLWVVITLRNTGSAEESFIRSFEQNTTRLSFDITPPDGRHFLYVSPLAPKGGSGDPVPSYLGPGEAYSASFELSWDARKPDFAWVLAQVGAYVIQAAYRTSDEDATVVRSNELHLVVNEPKGIDKKAYDLLSGIPREHETNLWMTKRDTDALVIERYNQILRLYPTSEYAPHVAFFLASFYHMRPGLKPSESAADDMERAAQLYELAAGKLGTSPLRLMALSSAARCYDKAGKAAQTWDAFEAAITCPGVTDEDRLQTLTYMRYLPNRPRQEGPTDPHLHLDSIAKSCGFTVKRDDDGTVQVSGVKVECSFDPGSRSIVLNGAERTGVLTSVENGRVLVSPEFVTALLVEQHRARSASCKASE